jgi:hypothetical protein
LYNPQLKIGSRIQTSREKNKSTLWVMGTSGSSSGTAKSGITKTEKLYGQTVALQLLRFFMQPKRCFI